MLDEKDQEFLRKRKRMVSWGNTVVFVMLLATISVFIWMAVTSPYIANPFYVYELLKKGEVEKSVMELAILLLPVVVVVLFVTLAIFIFFSFVFFYNEKRYLSIIDNLLNRYGKYEDVNSSVD